MTFNRYYQALTCVAQLIGHSPTKRKVTGLIPSQGTCLGCGSGPWLGCLREATLTLMFLSLSFSLPSPLYKTNKQTNK